MRLGLLNGFPQQRLELGEYLNGLYGYAMVLSRNRAEAEDLNPGRWRATEVFSVLCHHRT
jgi:hypothetical protein